MNASQLRKLNVIIQKRMMTIDQNRLLITLLNRPEITLTELSDIYYGPRGEQEKSTLRISYIKKYLKTMMFKLEYWGLDYVITVTKDGLVKFTTKEGTDEAEGI